MKKFRIITRHLSKPLQLYNDIAFHSFVSVEGVLLPKVKVTGTGILCTEVRKTILAALVSEALCG
jgi:hypothetical protein